jgi:hypothetical protein
MSPLDRKFFLWTGQPPFRLSAFPPFRLSAFPSSGESAEGWPDRTRQPVMPVRAGFSRPNRSHVDHYLQNVLVVVHVL